ncbi:hypothetical protein YB2330_005212 [Saitoella coloradoensis]
MDYWTGENVLSAIAVLILAQMVVFGWKLRTDRAKFRGRPGPPHSFIWGHLAAMGAIAKSDHHPDEVFQDFANKYGDVYYLNLWPMAYNMMIITDPDVADNLARSMVPKSPTYHESDALIGKHSILTMEGDEWKKLRKIFNPGFSYRNLEPLIPAIMEETQVFVEKLESLAKSGEVFKMNEEVTALTIDVIGRAILSVRLHTQKDRSHPMVHAFQNILHLTESRARFPLFENMRLYRRYQYWKNERTLDNYFGEQVRQHQVRAAANAKEGATKKDMDIIDLALLDAQRSIDEYAHQAKTFFLAGHDTTSSAVTWAYTELGHHAECLKKLREEHDAVLGPETANDTAALSQKLNQNPSLINKLPYTLQVMKEVLRLWPPAATARMIQSPSATLPVNNESWPADYMILYVPHYILHRDPKTWGPTANTFDPERFAEGREVPKAYQPFAKAPRSCIGQELALIEAKIILAFTARRFEFEPQIEEPYQISQLTAKPVGAMPMKVRVAV